MGLIGSDVLMPDGIPAAVNQSEIGKSFTSGQPGAGLTLPGTVETYVAANANLLTAIKSARPNEVGRKETTVTSLVGQKENLSASESDVSHVLAKKIVKQY